MLSVACSSPSFTTLMSKSTGWTVVNLPVTAAAGGRVVSLNRTHPSPSTSSAVGTATGQRSHLRATSELNFAEPFMFNLSEKTNPRKQTHPTVQMRPIQQLNVTPARTRRQLLAQLD